MIDFNKVMKVAEKIDKDTVLKVGGAILTTTGLINSKLENSSSQQKENKVQVPNLNKKGFTLVESLFAFSIFTTVIILLVSLYVTNSKTNIKVNQEYETYQSKKQQIEYTLNLDEGIETCLKKALH